jgi:hypothetical protein
MWTTTLAVGATAVVGWLIPVTLPWLAIGAGVVLVADAWRRRTEGFVPRSDHYRTLEKIRKKQRQTAEKKHRHIHDQISYIAESWGYTKEQERIIDRFIEARAYGEIYNRLTASILPQMILLIDNCNDRNQKGCKRDVSRRLRELTDLMRRQIQKNRSQKNEDFETTLEVYDRLLTSGKVQ